EGRVAPVKGFGPKTQERILRGIEMLRTTSGLHLYSAVRWRADELVAAIEQTGLATRVAIAGSLRRRREVVGDINIVAASTRKAELARAFPAVAPGVVEVVARGDTRVSLGLAEGIVADLRVVSEREFPAALLDFTGSKEHNTALGALATERGWKLSESGFSGGHGGEGEFPSVQSEEEIYARLGLQFVPPELREGADEIEAAARGQIPRLVEDSDVRGLIHVHTTESDGRATLEEMVSATRDKGYEWVAITDHSPTAAYAGGLTPERVRRQRLAIDAIRSRFPGFRIFHGTEADILADGSIDFGDEFLGVFDVVVASVHSRFGLPRDEQTKRLIRAVENPRVSVLGHPTGRLLLTRKGVDADVDAVLAAARRSGCAVEVNGSPHRLDLDWRLAGDAARSGMTFALGPDAHSIRELDNTAYAVGIARKGWVTAPATLNAKTAGELEAWLAKRRGAPLSSPGAFPNPD
ncbi:MAG TPA: PHP domain-containing protein, partial [Thermoanaerobaculia bacterium]